MKKGYTNNSNGIRNYKHNLGSLFYLYIIC